MSRQYRVMAKNTGLTTDPMVDMMSYTVKRLNPASTLSSTGLHEAVTSTEFVNTQLYSIELADIERIFERQKQWACPYNVQGTYSYSAGGTPMAGSYVLSGSDTIQVLDITSETKLPHTTLPDHLSNGISMGMDPGQYATLSYVHSCRDTYVKETLIEDFVPGTHLPDLYYSEATGYYYVNLSLFFQGVIFSGPSGTGDVLLEFFVYAGTEDFFATGTSVHIKTVKWHGMDIDFWMETTTPSADPDVFITVDPLTFDFYLLPTEEDAYWEFRGADDMPLYDKDTGDQLIFPFPHGFE